MRELKLSQQAQTAAIIAGAVLLGAWLIIHMTSDARRQNSAENELEDLQPMTGGNTTLLKVQFQNMANEAHAAMQGWGTNTRSLLNVIKQLSTDADARALDSAFGIRRGQSLGRWIQADYETKNVNRVLSNRGINYRFPLIDNTRWYEFG